jgi:hypothetical protein
VFCVDEYISRVSCKTFDDDDDGLSRVLAINRSIALMNNNTYKNNNNNNNNE